MNSKEFSLTIEGIVKDKKISYLEETVWYCEQNDLDTGQISSLVSNSLKEKMQEITRQEKVSNNSITAIQLKSKNWYGLKIQEQILASENKDLFLQKENFQIQKKIAQKHHKMKNSLEKASLHKKIEQEVAEKKHLLSVPPNNKSTVK